MWVVDKFDSETCTRIRQAVRSKVLTLPCACAKWFDMCPSLRNSTGHLILRKPEEWVQVFGPQIGTLLGSNPRNRILPAYDNVLLDLSALKSRLCNTTVPVFSKADGAFGSAAVTNASQAGVLTHELLPVLWEEVCAKESGCPWLSSEVVQSAEELLFTYRLRGGAWGKALFWPSGFCKSLSEVHRTDSIFFCH